MPNARITVTIKLYKGEKCFFYVILEFAITRPFAINYDNFDTFPQVRNLPFFLARPWGLYMLQLLHSESFATF